MLNLREINGILIQSFLLKIFLLVIYLIHIYVLFYASLNTQQNVHNHQTNVLSYNLFIHKSEWDWVLQGHQGARRGGELRKVIRGR